MDAGARYFSDGRKLFNMLREMYLVCGDTMRAVWPSRNSTTNSAMSSTQPKTNTKFSSALSVHWSDLLEHQSPDFIQILIVLITMLTFIH